jgi:hypothetical protein
MAHFMLVIINKQIHHLIEENSSSFYIVDGFLMHIVYMKKKSLFNKLQ